MFEQTRTANHLKVLRSCLGLTQEQFAYELGTTVSTVNRWENGRTEPSKLARNSIRGLFARKRIPFDETLLPV